MEVVFEGILEIGNNPDSKSSKDWKGRLFVLKRHTTTGRSSLDFYKSTSKRWQRQSIMGVLSLWPYFEVSLAHQCSYKYTLKLATTESVVYLASNSQGSMNKWLYHIQTQRVLEPNRDTYIYNVKAQESNSMKTIGVFGECQLALTSTFEILCVLIATQQVTAVWPLGCLRNFSCGNGVFSFESGRHAPQGPGEYSFITQHDHLIHGRLVKLMDKAKRSSSGSGSSRLSSAMDNRPPAQLPIQNRDSSSGSPVSSHSDSDGLPEIKIRDNVYMAPPKTTDGILASKTTPPPLPEVPPPKIPPKGLTSSDPMMEQRVDSVGRFLQGNAPPDDSGDHVYSHTLHRKVSQNGNADNPQIYNSLVHEGRPKRPSNYEIAYPDQKSSMPVVDSNSSSVYDTAYNDTDGRRQKPVLANIPPTIPGSLDGMTANPLYGSQGNLLEDIMSNQVFTSTPQAESPPLPPKPKSLSSSPESVKLPKPSHPDVTANPVYVSSNITSSGSVVLDCSSPNDNHSPPIGISSPPSNGIQKENIPDTGYYITGYSKVHKKVSESFQETFIPGSMESDPPLVPERQGSFNED